MTDFKTLINKSIKELRLSTGLSQEKFSEKCGLNSDNYRNIEYNRHMPNASTIDKICDTFNISVIELLQIGNKKEETDFTKRISEKISQLSSKQQELLNDILKVVKKY